MPLPRYFLRKLIKYIKQAAGKTPGEYSPIPAIYRHQAVFG